MIRSSQFRIQNLRSAAYPSSLLAAAEESASRFTAAFRSLLLWNELVSCLQQPHRFALRACNYLNRARTRAHAISRADSSFAAIAACRRRSTALRTAFMHKQEAHASSRAGSYLEAIAARRRRSRRPSMTFGCKLPGDKWGLTHPRGRAAPLRQAPPAGAAARRPARLSITNRQ